MKNLVLDKSILIIKNKYKDYDEEKLEIIRYGLEGIYLTITKAIVIFTLAILLNLFKELIIFLLLFNIIRFVSFGLHAKNSLTCLMFSTCTFLSIPYLCSILSINVIFKTIIFIPVIILIGYFSPADTEKRPIVSKKRRLVYKILSLLISVIYFIISITINNNFISNALLFSLIVQLFLINPISYKLFHVSYNNYLRYQK